VNQLILKRSELVSIAIALAMLLAISVFTALDWAEYRQNRDEVLAARHVFEHTNLLLLAVTAAETGQRGYLLTGDQAYLEPYRRALQSIPAELETLRTAETKPAQRQRVLELGSLIRAKVREMGTSVSLRERGDIPGSVALVRSGQGEALMDSIRRVAGRLHDEESALIETRSALVRLRSDRAHGITLAGSGLLLILLALGAWNIAAAAARREQLIAAIEAERGQTAEVRDLLQTTLASIGDAVLVTDSEGRVTFMNRIAESLTGWTAEAAAGRSETEVLRIVNESTRTLIESPVRTVLRDGQLVALPDNTLLLSKDGREIPVDDSGAPIRNQSGSNLGAVLVFRDVTNRRTAEREREQLLADAQRSRADAERQRSHLHSLFQQAPAIINIHRGPDHVYELVHPLAKELPGGRDVAGLSAREAAHSPEYVRVLDEVYASGQSRSIVEFPAGSPDAPAYFNYICCPWRDGDGSVAGVMTLGIDVTEQVRIRRAMQATEEQLRETAKLESLGVLAGGIAHDFNNLLVGIIGNASLALEMVGREAAVRGVIGDVLRAGERAATLTRQMLAYSGKGRFVVESVDLSSLVEEMLPLIQGSVTRAVTVRTQLAPHLPAVEADPAQLQQVFMNLVINGAEACEDRQGVVNVSTSLQQVDTEYIRTTFGVSEILPGDYVLLEVADNGMGMDEATRARIFDPFFTTKFTGRGLGLSAVLGIIRAHRGAIKVYSEPGRGSTFKVLFPAEGSHRPAAPAPAAVSGVTVNHGAVMVVDDEDIVRQIAGAALEQLGFEVIEARNGVEAVDLFRSCGAGVDLVILDLTMPLMTGEETLRRLRAIDPNVRVILSSGFNESDATRHFQGRGLAGFLQKPYTLTRLSERVQAALRS
jgi:PAS domain S-box-containing protein